MRGTFLLFLHTEEQQESRIYELMNWLHDVVGHGPQESGGWIVSPFNELSPGNWPQPFRMLTDRVDPELVMRAIRSVQFEHPVHLMYRISDEPRWSFTMLTWERTADEDGFPL